MITHTKKNHYDDGKNDYDVDSYATQWSVGEKSQESEGDRNLGLVS